MAFDRDVKEALERERRAHLDQMRRVAEKTVARYLAEGRTRNAEAFQNAAVRLFEHDDPTQFGFLYAMKRLPVSIEEFLHEKDFIGGVDMDIWPAIADDIRAVSKDIVLGEAAVFEYIDSGATGCHAPGARIALHRGGWKRVQDVAVGDYLMGPDRLPRRVLSLARGRESMRRLTLPDGTTHDVNASHILPVTMPDRRRDLPPITLTVRQIETMSPCARAKLRMIREHGHGVRELCQFAIEKLPEGNYYGFALDGDHLYLTTDGTVHHNTGKTMKAHISNAYQLYILHCLKEPQRMYGLAKQTPIVFSMTSSDSRTTADVLYRPFRSLIENIPFFQRYTSWNRDLKSKIEFSNGIDVEAVIATTQGIIGRAIIAAHVDESNYMSVVVGSSRAGRGDGRQGVYDQADSFYRAVRLRKRSRFSSQYPVPGHIILSSSAKHTDDFLDRRIAEVNSVEGGEPGVVVFRHKQYDVQPADRFSKKRFRLLVGTTEYGTRILKDTDEAGVHYPENARIELVPENYRYEFTHRPEDALRDVCGIASVNLTPFITQRHKIIESMQRWEYEGNAHPVQRENVDLAEHGMPILRPEYLDSDTTTPRFVHIDLSRTGDRCGIAMTRIDRMLELPIADDVESGATVYERVPYFTTELAISIKPSQAAPLDIAAVRNWVVELKTVHGVPIYMVTYDGFDSAESVQALRAIGIRSEVISLDRSDAGYTTLRRALYQDRADLPPNDILKHELTNLEKDEKSGKVDHPPKGSKDISDAVAGTMLSAITSRPYRTEFYFTDGRGNRILPPGR